MSFDVISLFTNVPVPLALSIARKRLLVDDSLEERTNLSVDEVCTLLGFCLNATYLAFQGVPYKQTFGTAMGSPVSVTIADLVMEDVEERALSSFPFPPRFWKRYVDDTCCAILSTDIQAFHQHLNSIEASIQFTVEVEDKGVLPFLDTLLTHHSNGSITTSVFRKKTHTDKYLDFSSHHPLSHKLSVVKTLFNRARSISSTPSNTSTEESHITNALVKNGYPRSIIKRVSQTTISRSADPPPPKPTTTIVLPYVHNTSEQIRRALSPLNIRVCFRPHTTLRKILSHPKDPIPACQKPGVVYSIPCSSCDLCYIGQTGRTLNDRRKEHLSAVKSHAISTSALAEHSILTGHKIDWENSKIMATETAWDKRCYLESCFIRSTKETMNRDFGSLPPIYNCLLAR